MSVHQPFGQSLFVFSGQLAGDGFFGDGQKRLEGVGEGRKLQISEANGSGGGAGLSSVHGGDVLALLDGRGLHLKVPVCAGGRC